MSPTPTPPRLRPTLLALTALAGLCAHAELPTGALSYYSGFDTGTDFIPTQGDGRWNTTQGDGPTFVTIAGDNRALDLSATERWTNDSGQTVLPADATAFTIAVRAKLGMAGNGLLFAFGSKADGGLALRRDDAAGKFVVSTGLDSERIVYTPTSPRDYVYRTYILTYDADQEQPLTLYVDDATTAVGTGTVEGALIATSFQWSKRFTGMVGTEKAGTGAIDAMGVWTKALSEEERAAVLAEMAPKNEAIAFTAIPEGWGTAPTEAYPIEVATGTVSLESIPAARQTLGGRATNVAQVWDAANTPTVYGIGDEGVVIDEGNPITRDVWLKLSKARFATVVGGKGNGWGEYGGTKGLANANAITGNIVVELTGSGTRAQQVVGALTGCGNGGRGDAKPFTGNTLVTIAEGAKVTGNVVGAVVAGHTKKQPFTGNSTVRILALQDTVTASHSLNGDVTAGHIIGGSATATAAADNRGNSGSAITGCTAVEVTLAEGTEGAFLPSIYGASFANAAAPHTVSGTSSVTIDAPAGVTFSGDIVAGGRGSGVSVAGAATLTLKGGSFIGNLLPVANGATVGSSALVIEVAEGKTIDLSNAIIGDFDSTTVTLTGGTLALGEMRLPEVTLAENASGTIAVAPSTADIAAGSVTLCKLTGDAVPANLTVSAPDLQAGTWEAQAVEGTLRYVRTDAAQDLTWATPTEGSNWSAGLPDFKPGDNATFGTNAANESVTLDQDILAGAVTVAGDYTLNGNGALTANTVTISEGGTLTLGTANFASARYVRWSPTARTTTGDNTDQGVALAEFGLYWFGERVDMTGATVTATQAQSVGTGSNRHEAAYLLDGNLSTKWYWISAPATFTNCSITFDAGEGQAFVFDAYNLAMADQNGRNPREWKLEISNDNSTWTLLDQQSFTTEEANTWTTGAWLDEAFQVRQVRNVAITVAEGVSVNGILTAAGGIVGDVTFGETGTLKLAAGKYLMINGAVTAPDGGIVLDTSAVLADGYAGQTFLVAQGGLTFANLPEGFVVNEVSMTGALSQYILAKDAPFPWKATLSGDTTWLGATWTDANGAPVDPALWTVTYAPSVSVELTVDSETTLSDLSGAVGAVTVKGAAPLTLSGGSFNTASLTIDAGAELRTDTAQFRVLALNEETPASATVNGTWVMNASSGYTLPAISGAGTIVKTGTGTLSLGRGTVVAPTVRVEEGVFALASGDAYADIPNVEVVGDAIFGVDQWNNAITDAEATISLIDGGAIRLQNGNGRNNHANRKIMAAVVVDNDGTAEKAARILGSSNGDSSNFAGGISGKGTLLFTGGEDNGYSIREVGVSDGLDGVLKLRVADANSDGSGNDGATRITFSVDSTYTGGTEIVNLLHVAAADALGKGPVAIEATGKLVVDNGTTLNVYGAIKNAGTIAGAIALQNGASIDASAGAVAFDALSVAEGVTIPVTLSAEVAVGAELATWATGTVDAAAFSAELPAGLALAVDGTTLKVVEGAPAGDLTWKNGSADWATGLPGYAAGANVTFGANESAENVVVPADTPAAGAITVSGDYALGAENFDADSLEVTTDGSLTLLSQPISARYVTFMALSTGTISEFTLYRDGEPVNLEGMAVSGVESAANAVDGSTETDVSFGQAMAFIQIDAGEGKTISFDSYNVAAGADASKFPDGWYLLAGSTQTPDSQTDIKALVSMADEEAPVAKTYLWETPRALSGSTGSKLSVANTVTIAGTIGGNGTITAKTIEFAEGAAIKPTGVGYLTLSAEQISGATELVLDTSALNLPTEADPTTNVVVLFTTIETDFTFTGVPEGYRVRNLGGIIYALTKDFAQPFTAEVGAGTTAWANLKWTDADGVEIPAPILTLLAGDVANLEFALTATAERATVQVAAREPGALTINASEHRLTLTSPTTVAFAPKALTVNGDLYVGDGALTLPAETTLNATLTYATFSKDEVSGTVTGAGSIVKTGTGTLAIAEGANIGVNVEVQAGTLAPAANTTLADLALVDGATLDLSAGPLAITGTLTVPGIVDEADAPVINVIPPTDFVITEKPQVLVTYDALDSGELEPADLAVMTEDENWVVDFGETAITVWLEPAVTLPDGVKDDTSGTAFSEAAKAAILEQVGLAQEGGVDVSAVESVSLTLNGQPADTATFNDLAACLDELPLSLLIDEENNSATAEGAYNLTVTSIEITDGKVVVAAELTFMAESEEGGEVAMPLTLVPGVKVELVPVTLDGTEPGDVLGTATVETASEGELPMPEVDATAGTVLFKVRLTPPAAE